MKKHFIYILTLLIFISQNLFAQSAADTEGMDMSVYAGWMGSVFLLMLFIMSGIFLYSAGKEPAATENIVLQVPSVFVKQQINFASGNSLYLYPGISLELKRLRLFIVSALITFSLVLFLLIIQK